MIDPGRRRSGGATARRATALALLALALLALTVLMGGRVGAQDAGTMDAARLLGLAEGGDARAAFVLGTRYATGTAAARDDSEAVRWFRRAAEAGLAEAQYNLAVMIGEGRGGERDMSEAAHWFELAAEQGLAEAQFNLGTLYGMGLGVERDEARAVALLRRAAESELPEAEYNLGVLYEHGRGVRPDLEAALHWYGRAAARGFGLAAARHGALEKRLAAAGGKSGTPAATASADRKADRKADREPAPPKQTSSAVAPAGGTGSDAGAWVMAQNPDHYTVQVLSHTDEAAVRRFLANVIGRDDAGYYAFDRDGVPWYAAVVGVYPDHASAKRSIAKLPASIRRTGPWARAFKTVQALATKGR